MTVNFTTQFRHVSRAGIFIGHLHTLARGGFITWDQFRAYPNFVKVPSPVPEDDNEEPEVLYLVEGQWAPPTTAGAGTNR